MKVIAINGSPKPKGNTYMALKTVCDELEQQEKKLRFFMLEIWISRAVSAAVAVAVDIVRSLMRSLEQLSIKSMQRMVYYWEVRFIMQVLQGQ